MQRDSDHRVAPVFEKGYPSFEAVNNINNQERYHNYILRKLQELKDDKETGKVD
jgi:hypothetical protein